MTAPRLFKTRAEFDAFTVSPTARAQRIWRVFVLHDDGCSVAQCRCAPWYRVEPLTAANYFAGEAAQRRWQKERLS